MKVAFMVTLALVPAVLMAGEPVVLKVSSFQSGNLWTFEVTLEHADEGWDHYADGWGIYLPSGQELGYRILAHPHVREQPFTRSLDGIAIPDDVPEVIVRPRDTVHGDGKYFSVKLKR